MTSGERGLALHRRAAQARINKNINGQIKGLEQSLPEANMEECTQSGKTDRSSSRCKAGKVIRKPEEGLEVKHCLVTEAARSHAVLVNIQLRLSGVESSGAAFADFYGADAPLKACFKLPVRPH